MFYDFDDFFMMMIFIAIALSFFAVMRRMMSSKPTTSASTAAEPKKSDAERMAEDMKATKTSQVADAVSILDDLGSTTSNYRHYCELVGTSMASSNIIAPYSKRPVAYYDIKCYRIDAVYGGGQRETLVAHEHSFDPFFFTDGSSDTPIYVDLESFGENVILVNSTNHIEGPNSDFAKAAKNSTSAATGRTGGAYAMVAHEVARGAHALLGAADALRRALTPRPALEPAYAAAGVDVLASSQQSHDGKRSNVMFSQSGRGVHGAHQQRDMTIRVGNADIHVHSSPMPPHLGDFMGRPTGPWVMGGGYTTHRPTSANPADLILGMGLGALLNSMNTTQQQVLQQTTTAPQDTFRGYRLVENVVPLGSPVYCIGEIYRHGTDVYMGRSLAKDYPTSYFATKPESEVLSAIGS